VIGLVLYVNYLILSSELQHEIIIAINIPILQIRIWTQRA
jgi:hypothetical protein